MKFDRQVVKPFLFGVGTVLLFMILPSVAYYIGSTNVSPSVTELPKTVVKEPANDGAVKKIEELTKRVTELENQANRIQNKPQSTPAVNSGIQPANALSLRLYSNMINDELNQYFLLHNTLHTTEGLKVFLPDYKIKTVVIPQVVLQKFGDPKIYFYSSNDNPLGYSNPNSIQIFFAQKKSPAPTFNYNYLFGSVSTFIMDIGWLVNDTTTTLSDDLCPQNKYSSDIQTAASILFSGSNAMSTAYVPQTDLCKFILRSHELPMDSTSSSGMYAYYIDLVAMARVLPTSTFYFFGHYPPTIFVIPESGYLSSIDGGVEDGIVITAGFEYDTRGIDGEDFDRNNPMVKEILGDVEFVQQVQKKIISSLKILGDCGYGCAY